MAIREYIYADARRLDAYVEQIGSPVTYDKVPVWSAEFGLTGPRAAAAQERRGRSLTLHEKVESLLEYLTTSKLVHQGRPAIARRGPEPGPFVLESCKAIRVEIPRKALEGDSKRGLSLWVSTPEPTSPLSSENEEASPGLLCLLEDFQYSDQEPFSGYEPSAYSLLWALTYNLREELRDLVIGDEFESVGREDTWGNRVDAWHKSTHHMGRFAQDPVGSLKSWGCTPGPARYVRVLYRIREFGPENARFRRSHSVSLFGYPVVIWSANGVTE